MTKTLVGAAEPERDEALTKIATAARYAIRAKRAPGHHVYIDRLHPEKSFEPCDRPACVYHSTPRAFAWCVCCRAFAWAVPFHCDVNRGGP